MVHDGGPDNQAVFEIDDQELSPAEFGRMMTTFAGWGTRIVVVFDDRLHLEPKIVVKEPEER